jgi:hypothetical protein
LDEGSRKGREPGKKEGMEDGKREVEVGCERTDVVVDENGDKIGGWRDDAADAHPIEWY